MFKDKHLIGILTQPSALHCSGEDCGGMPYRVRSVHNKQVLIFSSPLLVAPKVWCTRRVSRTLTAKVSKNQCYLVVWNDSYCFTHMLDIVTEMDMLLSWTRRAYWHRIYRREVSEEHLWKELKSGLRGNTHMASAQFWALMYHIYRDKARVSSVKSSRFPVAGVVGNLINPNSPLLFPVPHTRLSDCLRVLQACFRTRRKCPSRTCSGNASNVHLGMFQI